METFKNNIVWLENSPYKYRKQAIWPYFSFLATNIPEYFFDIQEYIIIIWQGVMTYIQRAKKSI